MKHLILVFGAPYIRDLTVYHDQLIAPVPVNILHNSYNVLIIIFQVRLWSIQTDKQLFFVDEILFS